MDKQKNGLDWPKDPIERAILERLELKSSHEYMWPRWAAAHEAAQAVREYVRNNDLARLSSSERNYVLPSEVIDG